MRRKLVRRRRVRVAVRIASWRVGRPLSLHVRRVLIRWSRCSRTLKSRRIIFRRAVRVGRVTRALKIAVRLAVRRRARNWIRRVAHKILRVRVGGSLSLR
jgi:hypothetical protein